MKYVFIRIVKGVHYWNCRFSFHFDHSAWFIISPFSLYFVPSASGSPWPGFYLSFGKVFSYNKLLPHYQVDDQFLSWGTSRLGQELSTPLSSSSFSYSLVIYHWNFCGGAGRVYGSWADPPKAQTWDCKKQDSVGKNCSQNWRATEFNNPKGISMN